MVDMARDGLDDERAAMSRDYDLIVLDIMLPDRGALQILRTVRQALGCAPLRARRRIAGYRLFGQACGHQGDQRRRAPPPWSASFA